MNPIMSVPQNKERKSDWLAWAVLCTGLMATAVVSLYVKADVETDARSQFESSGNEINLRIAARMAAHAQVLRSAAALFDANDGVTRQAWQAFTARQKVAEYLPGIQGIGFALVIPRDRLAAHVQEIRRQGFADYNVRPAGERETYTSIIYLEPFSGRNLRAFGYDMFSEPVRRTAMERARDLDLAVLSGKVTLVQETDRDVQFGTLMYVPVYRKGLPTATPDQRRAALYGWVYSPYRMNDLMQGILSKTDLAADKPIRLEVFDGQQVAPETLLYDSQVTGKPGATTNAPQAGRRLVSIIKADRWQLRLTRKVEWSNYLSVATVLGGGTTISLLLFGLFRSRRNTWFRAQQLAEQLTVDLRESEEKHRIIYNNEVYAICIYEVASLKLLDVNRAFAQLYGYRPEELLAGMTFGQVTVAAQDAAATTQPASGTGASFIPLQYHRKKDGTVFPVEIVGGAYTWKGQAVIFALLHDITERVQGEQVLRAKTALLEAQTNASLDGILVVATDHKRILVNQRILEIFEVPQAIVADADDAALLQHVVSLTKHPKAFLERVSYLYEHPDVASHEEIEFKDGMVLDRYSAPVLGRDGENYGRIWTFRDITERKRAEVKLRESEALFRTMADNAPVLIWMAGTDKGCFYFNQVWLSFTGRTLAQEQGDGWTAGIHPEELARCLKTYEESFDAQQEFKMEYRLRRHDGEYRWLLDHGVPRYHTDGAFAGYIGSCVDITEDMHAATALRENAVRLALAVRVGGVGIWGYDVVNNQLTWDDQMFRLYGITRDQFGGAYAAWQAGLHPEDRQRGDAETQSALQGEKEFNTEFRVLWPDGSIHNIRALAVVERHASGRPLRMFGTNWDITAQKQLEAKLKSGEENFRNFFETIGDMILVTTPPGQVLFANHALKRELGYTDEEVVARHVLDFNPADQRPEAEQIFAAMLRGERKSCPLPLVTKQGETIPAETRVWLGQWNGKDCLFGVSKDLRLEMEAQNRFERLFRSNPTLMALSTIPERQFSDVNDAFLTVLGYSAAEVIGKTAAEIGLFVQPEQQTAAADKLLREGRIVGFEMKVRRKDGIILDGLFSGEIITTQGQPVLLTVMIDITALKQASARLSKLSQAVEFCPSMILITDRSGHLEYVNPAWVRATGYSLEEAIGQTPRLVKSGIHPPGFYAEMWTEVLAGRIWRGEICNRTKSGRIFWESAAIAPVHNEAGVITHLVGVKEDITARKQVAEELRLAKGAAEAANRAKSAFLANMSHEIRTPMNAIMGFSQLLLRDEVLSARQQQHLTTITRSGQHLLEIINAVLEMARIETGRISLKPSAFDLHLLLEDLERLFRLRADTELLQFRFERQGDLPRYVQTDQTKLRQVFINLLGNALKFTPRGGEITVRLRATDLPDQKLRLHAEIQDTGTGIAPADLPHLFQPFFQTLSGKQVSGGTGLGLALSREFVQALGGELTVTSQLGSGSTFQFDVLMDHAAAAAALGDAPPARVRHLRPGQPACRVLLVDDQRENSTLLEHLLAPLGFETRIVENGADAVVQSQTWLPNVVLMDLLMPVMDGFEAIRQIRAAQGPAIKIIILSASVFPESQERGLESGADAFMGKPFHEMALLARIQQLTGVNYVYAGEEAEALPAAVAAPEIPTPATIRRLPVALVAALREATCRAEYDQMLVLADQAATYDEQLGRSLRLLIERFDYATLQRILTV